MNLEFDLLFDISVDVYVATEIANEPSVISHFIGNGFGLCHGDGDGIGDESVFGHGTWQLNGDDIGSGDEDGNFRKNKKI